MPGWNVLVVGSADVYGRVDASDLPITETCPLRPVSPYAASKVAADFLAVQAGLGFGLEVIRTRRSTHLGPGQSPRFVAPALAQRVAQAEVGGGGNIAVGNLTPKRDFTDVRDVDAPTGCWCSTGSPVRPTTSARVLRWPCNSWLMLLSNWPPSTFVSRPIRTSSVRWTFPVLLGDASKIRCRHRLDPRDSVGDHARRSHGHARARVATP